MKTINQSKKILIGIFTILMLIAMTLGLGACDTKKEESSTITKYNTSLEAAITMGPAGSISFGDVLSDVYVTNSGEDCMLTLIFKTSQISVMGVASTIFVDDDPDTTNENDGTIGWYKADGTLITDGVKVTYSSGDDYVTKASKNLYYVKSISFAVDELKQFYDLTLYINSNMKGVQFSMDGYSAKLNIDLESGEKVEQVNGLGVDTKAEAPQLKAEK